MTTSMMRGKAAIMKRKSMLGVIMAKPNVLAVEYRPAYDAFFPAAPLGTVSTSPALILSPETPSFTSP
jgi:hypothetical protein